VEPATVEDDALCRGGFELAFNLSRPGPLGANPPLAREADTKAFRLADRKQYPPCRLRLLGRLTHR
jgi:hypothetical protein